MKTEPERARIVGPVLANSAVGRAVAAAIADHNQDVRVEDRGSYLRVSVQGRCRVTRAAIEDELRAVFALPGDLERVMPSFRGRLRVTAKEAIWE